MSSGTQLNAQQLKRFHRDASGGTVTTARRLIRMIRDSVKNPDGEICIGDLGGGDGLLLDGLLESMPCAQGVLVDIAQEMVDRNREHPRKVVLQGDLSTLDEDLPANIRFDVVLFNLVLHHCLGESVSGTRTLQEEILKQAGRRLKPGGQIFVLEQIHETAGVPGLGSHVIYWLTKSKLIAPLTRRFGANTAGVGVLFASQPRLRRLFHDAGMNVQRDKFFRRARKSWVFLAVGSTNSEQRLYSLEPR